MAEKTLAQVAYEEYWTTGRRGAEPRWSILHPDDKAAWEAGVAAAIQAHEARRWQAWPDGENDDTAEYPPNETDVEIYCGKWASKDRLIGRISKRSGTYGPSGASHWRFLPAPPQEGE